MKIGIFLVVIVAFSMCASGCVIDYPRKDQNGAWSGGNPKIFAAIKYARNSVSLMEGSSETVRNVVIVLNLERTNQLRRDDLGEPYSSIGLQIIASHEDSSNHCVIIFQDSDSLLTRLMEWNQSDRSWDEIAFRFNGGTNAYAPLPLQ